MSKPAQNAPLPLSDTAFKPTWKGRGREAGATESEAPGGTAMEAIHAFRHRTMAVVEASTNRFVTPEKGAGKPAAPRRGG